MDRRWLLTVAADRLGEVTDRVRGLGCEVSLDAAVPMDDDTVIPVSGPEERALDLRAVPGVKAVHPDSDLTLY